MASRVEDTPRAVVDGQAWTCIDFVSDLHLQANEPASWRVFAHYLQHTPAQALFVMGDLFEVWVGDDVLGSPSGAFERQVAAALALAAQRLSLFWIPGNRDFLTGTSFAQASGAQPLSDPCVLQLKSECCLLSHGDALCLQDLDYMAFRAQVRDSAWQQAFLARPLAERQALARQMREQSQTRQQALTTWADVDPEAARQWLRASNAQRLIHGHTHRPGEHDLGDGLWRSVLSDWCATPPARAQVMRYTDHWQRINLPL